jgi:uncharacterized protein DUF3471
VTGIQNINAIWSSYEKGQDQERETTDAERHADAKPSHPLADYVGKYAADGYAPFVIKQEGEQLYDWLGGEWWNLDHYHYDVFELDMKHFELHMKIAFQTDTRGAIVSLSIPIEPAVKDVIFTRRPVSLSPEQMAALTGEYDLPFEGLMLTILHKSDGKLFAQITGQTEIELIPYRMTADSSEFNFKDQPNVSVAFT